MKTIQLLGHYRNLSVSIAEGVYEINDERLHGLAGYLVDSGHAALLGSATPAILTSVSQEETAPLEVTETEAVEEEAPQEQSKKRR